MEADRHNIPFSWVKRAAAGTSDGTFVEKTDGREYLITYRKMDTADWYCFTINESREDLFHSPSLLVLLCVTNIVFSLVLTFFLSRKLYSPIHYTIRELNQLAGVSDIRNTEEITDQNDEFAYVSSVVSALSDKVQNLKLENTNNLEILKKSFLSALIQEDNVTANLEKAWRVYNIRLFGPEIYLLLVAVDPLPEGKKKNGLPFMEILKTGLENYLSDLCSMELIPKEESQYVILYTPLTRGTEYRLPIDRLEKLQEFVTLSASSSLTLVEEGNCYPAARIYEGYKNALRLLKERFVLGYGRIIFG